ncbi:MAG: trypsin-like serine protease [Alphaproteobacteria bacterium]|nr:trypsin-like serine protease [Alphaproteobacteria bacterium]
MRSLFCLLRAALLGLVAVAVGAPAAQAILIRNTSDPGYVTGNSAFTGVVNIAFNFLNQAGTFRCSGALLADGIHVVTAGHCLDGANNWQITFETPTGPTTLGIAAGGVHIHPLFADRPFPLDNIDQYDVGVLKLASLAPRRCPALWHPGGPARSAHDHRARSRRLRHRRQPGERPARLGHAPACDQHDRCGDHDLHRRQPQRAGARQAAPDVGPVQHRPGRRGPDRPGRQRQPRASRQQHRRHRLDDDLSGWRRRDPVHNDTPLHAHQSRRGFDRQLGEVVRPECSGRDRAARARDGDPVRARGAGRPAPRPPPQLIAATASISIISSGSASAEISTITLAGPSFGK